MRLSDQPEYLVAVPAAVEGDLSTARENLNIVLRRARGEGDTLTVGLLLQLLGDVEARDGNISLAHSLHEEAIALNPHTPICLFYYARGLVRAFRKPELALIRLTEVEAFLESDRWNPKEEDELPKLWYEREIEALRQEIASLDS
jgi:hypothetical protein